MRHFQVYVISIFFFSLIFSFPVSAQPWNFIKEKDGIKIFTRVEAGKSLRSYKGVTDINSPADEIFTLMEDINNTEWWDKNLTHIKVLLYEKNKRAQYYLVYDLPLGVTDRDLCVDVKISIDQVTGERSISAVALNGVIPERNEMVRIKDYRQTWTIIPAGEDLSHVVLDGYVDPAGTIPDWIADILIIESPIKAINGLKNSMEKK